MNLGKKSKIFSIYLEKEKTKSQIKKNEKTEIMIDLKFCKKKRKIKKKNKNLKYINNYTK